MPKIMEADFGQMYLLPPCLEDWIPRDHPARLVREIVEQMDLAAEGFTQPLEGSVGRPAYAPALLLRLWIYGYLNGVDSTRKLEQASRDTMGYIWLCGQLAPDHNSLWRFWSANEEVLDRVFKRTVFTAKALGLVGGELLAIDGTKIATASSGVGVWNEAALERELARIKAGVRAAGEADEQRELALSDEERLAREEVARTGFTREAVEAALERVRSGETERQYCHPREPEAQRMKLRSGGNPFAYNAQVAVDSQERIIVAAEVSGAINDDYLALPLMEQAEENSGARPPAVADTGYYCAESQHLTQQNGRVLLTPLPANVANEENKPYHVSQFNFDPVSMTMTCPQGRELPRSSTRRHDGQLRHYFRSYRVCKGCPLLGGACTRSKRGRTVDIPAVGHEAVQTHRKRLQDPAVQRLMRLRGQLVEPVFGWIKAHDGFRRFSVKGLDAADAQWKMVCAVRNLRRIYRAWVQYGCQLSATWPA